MTQHDERQIASELSHLSNSKYVRAIFKVLSKTDEIDSIVALCEKIAFVEGISPSKVHYGRVHEALKSIVSKTSLIEIVESKGRKKIVRWKKVEVKRKE